MEEGKSGGQGEATKAADKVLGDGITYQDLPPPTRTYQDLPATYRTVSDQEVCRRLG